MRFENHIFDVISNIQLIDDDKSNQIISFSTIIIISACVLLEDPTIHVEHVVIQDWY